MMQVTVTAAQTNATNAATHILNLAIAAGIGNEQCVVKFHTTTLRNNALAAMFINRKTLPNGNNCALRYRNGSLAVIPIQAGYDIAMYVGDVYDIFAPATTLSTSRQATSRRSRFPSPLTGGSFCTRPHSKRRFMARTSATTTRPRQRRRKARWLLRTAGNWLMARGLGLIVLKMHHRHRLENGRACR